MSDQLPLPPVEMRQLVAPTDPKFFDNPDHALVFPDIPLEKQASVFDFGCGCGRIARQLIQQEPRPKNYLGIDLHKGMIKWCVDNLKPHASGFDFLHHDVYNLGFNPNGKTDRICFPVRDRTFSLVIAWSVFTHLLESQAEFYLKEVARILDTDGIFLSTWFTFDKQEFPMMQTFQNALYINETDLTNAVIFDRAWLKTALANVGLVITRITPPQIRGFQWLTEIEHSGGAWPEVDFPEDRSPIGIYRSPVIEKRVDKIGL